MFVVGKFSLTHGLKGGIKLISYCDNPEDIFSFKLFIEEGREINCKKIGNTSRKDIFIVQVDEIDRIEDVEIFKNKNVLVDNNELENLESNSFYINDLLNMKVISNGGCGVVENVYNYGAADTIEIRWENGKTESVPFVEQYIREVDKENRIVYINEPTYI